MSTSLPFFHELPRELQDDPGDPKFLECCEHYRDTGDVLKALALCSRGLSANPSHHQARLFLAKIFFELGCVPFATREIDTLIDELPHVDSLRRLRDRIVPSGPDSSAMGASEASPSSTTSDQAEPKPVVDETLAEADFDFSELDLMDDED